MAGTGAVFSRTREPRVREEHVRYGHVPSERQSDSRSSPSRLRERARVRARDLRHRSTDAERSLWNALRNRRVEGHKFRRQHPIGPYIADFVCLEARLVVELDGGQHYTHEGRLADARRTRYLEVMGFDVLRFSDRDVLLEQEAVMSVVLERLAKRVVACAHPHPNPLPPAGEGARQATLPPAGEGAEPSAPLETEDRTFIKDQP